MARTSILPTDPNKRKAWCAKVAQDSAKEMYWSRMIGEEGSLSVITRKTDAEAGMGDEITTAIVAKFRGKAITEGQKLAGREFKLQTAAHTMRVNEFRHGVNIGARIEQSRVGFNLKRQGRQKLTDYIKELGEEVITMALNGARGIGDEIQHHDLEYTGYPNPLRAPDAAHWFIGKAGDKAKATLDGATDKLALTTVNKLRVKAKKMLGGQPDKAVKMTPVPLGGKKGFLFAVCAEGMQDIRDDTGAQGWFEAQKALVSAIGKDAEMFQGGAGWFNGALVDEMGDTCVKFGDYGAGANTPAARALFMGAGAGCVANGTKGLTDGMTVALGEDTDDRDHDAILFFEMIFGADKVAYNGMDLGVISVDHAYTAAA